jgi:cytochrome c-type biogenesis protein CcmH/NrfF
MQFCLWFFVFSLLLLGAAFLYGFCLRKKAVTAKDAKQMQRDAEKYRLRPLRFFAFFAPFAVKVIK